MPTCRLKVKCGAKTHDATVSSSEEGKATKAEILAWFAGAEPQFRVSKLLCKQGRTLRTPEDTVSGGELIKLLGEHREVNIGGLPRAAFVPVPEVVSCVFSYLPLRVVRATCAAVCRDWNSLCEISTRSHTQRYGGIKGCILDLYHLSPVGFEELAVPQDHRVALSCIYGLHLYVMASPCVKKRDDPPPVPTTILDDSDDGSDDGMPGGALAAPLPDAVMAGADGSDDSEGSDAEGLDDDDYIYELGLTSASLNEDGVTVHEFFGDGCDVGSYRRQQGEARKSQGAWVLTCIDLKRRKVVWKKRRDEIDAESCTVQSRLRPPVNEMIATNSGVVLKYDTKLTLLSKASGKIASEMTRVPGWDGLFNSQALMSSHEKTASNPRDFSQILVLQGRELHFLTHDLHLAAEPLLLPNRATSVVAYDRAEKRLIFSGVGMYIGLSIANKAQPQALWMQRHESRASMDFDMGSDDDSDGHHMPSNTRVVALTETNVLFASGRGGVLMDSIGRHYRIQITGHRVFGLLEGEEGFAEGVFVHGGMANDSVSRRIRDSGYQLQEVWDEAAMTDTNATHPHASNTTLQPHAPKWEEVLALEAAAPPRVSFDSTQDFNSPSNIESRRYNAYMKTLAELMEEVKREAWRDTHHSLISFHAITRERIASKNLDKAAVKRGLVSLWDVHIPFPPSALSSGVRQGNMLYVGITFGSVVGVYGIAIDRGFVKWRRVWKMAGATRINIQALEGIVMADVVCTARHFVSFYNAVTGVLHYASSTE
eukprot:TRINITY_DN11270_c1_g1_i1.p1 TRINITY_DN11270_c1_g1~~TRINITY_DN11270_c1_g1_i1.p1  ORF type:complete len:767 (+),score=268.12 TRINITY_DN11270_c1_g1_i1:157-2457(+)